MPAWFLTFGGAFFTLLQVLGICHAGHAILKTRTAQGTIAWVVALIFIPIIAIPAYWLFGRSRFIGYLAWQKDPEHILSRRQKELRTQQEQHRAHLDHETDAFLIACEHSVSQPATEGNDVELLIDGDVFFSTLKKHIIGAQHSILLQYFIWHNDDIGQELLDLLIQKAQEGVTVCVLIDRIGSNKTSNAFFQPLEDVGGKASFFSAANRKRGTRLQVNFRNHRKIAIFDSSNAILGGFNIGNEYAGLDPKFGKWRDTAVILQGPGVASAQLVFLEAWDWAEKRIPSLDYVPKFSPHDETVLVLPSGPTDHLETCHLFFINAAACAKERLWITTPYYVPDLAVVAALTAAALRGVDVRILIPEKTDHYIAHLASFSYLDSMTGAGISIHRYKDGFLHQKVLLMDSQVASIGSANLDNRSFRLNFELNILASSQSFIHEVEAMLQKDFDRSEQIKKGALASKNIGFKILVYLARTLAPLL